ncbi:MAG: hypothetical protein ACJ786_25850 [Catenulispora sp.]
MLPLLLVTAGALACARLTRLLTADRLTQPLRRRCLQAVREGGLLEYLIVCAWCTSMYVGAVVAAAVIAAVPEFRPSLPAGLLGWFLTALAYSHLTGRLARTEVEV